MTSCWRSDRAGSDPSLAPEEAQRRAERGYAEGDSLEDRCKRRQAPALLGLGAGGGLAAAAVAWSTYRMGRRAAREDSSTG